MQDSAGNALNGDFRLRVSKKVKSDKNRKERRKQLMEYCYMVGMLCFSENGQRNVNPVVLKVFIWCVNALKACFSTVKSNNS